MVHNRAPARPGAATIRPAFTRKLGPCWPGAVCAGDVPRMRRDLSRRPRAVATQTVIPVGRAPDRRSAPSPIGTRPLIRGAAIRAAWGATKLPEARYPSLARVRDYMGRHPGGGPWKSDRRRRKNSPCAGPWSDQIYWLLPVWGAVRPDRQEHVSTLYAGALPGRDSYDSEVRPGPAGSSVILTRVPLLGCDWSRTQRAMTSTPGHGPAGPDAAVTARTCRSRPDGPAPGPGTGRDVAAATGPPTARAGFSRYVYRHVEAPCVTPV